MLETWGLWLEAHFNSEMVKKEREFGTWRVVLDLAESVNRDLGPDTCAYSEGEIVGALKGKILWVIVLSSERTGLHTLGCPLILAQGDISSWIGTRTMEGSNTELRISKYESYYTNATQDT
jgi:hypothetical protein